MLWTLIQAGLYPVSSQISKRDQGAAHAAPVEQIEDFIHTATQCSILAQQSWVTMRLVLKMMLGLPDEKLSSYFIGCHDPEE